MKILIVGDVFSKLGRRAFETNLQRIKEKEKINFIIVNGENTSHGKGMNVGHYKWYLERGVNIITMGNHTYNNRSIIPFLDEVNNIVRPYNFKEGLPGKGYTTIKYNDITITVLQVIGRVFMDETAACPYKKTREILDAVKSDIYICDFHAEATSEKVAFGYAFDGEMQIIYGTHTHVQTNDARILEKGTAYITDVGMTGPLDGVIGVNKEIILERLFDNGMQKFEPQETGLTQFNAIIVEIDDKTKKTTKIDTIHVIE